MNSDILAKRCIIVFSFFLLSVLLIFLFCLVILELSKNLLNWATSDISDSVPQKIAVARMDSQYASRVLLNARQRRD